MHTPPHPLNSPIFSGHGVQYNTGGCKVQAKSRTFPRLLPHEREADCEPPPPRPHTAPRPLGNSLVHASPLSPPRQEAVAELPSCPSRDPRTLPAPEGHTLPGRNCAEGAEPPPQACPCTFPRQKLRCTLCFLPASLPKRKKENVLASREAPGWRRGVGRERQGEQSATPSPTGGHLPPSCESRASEALQGPSVRVPSGTLLAAPARQCKQDELIGSRRQRRRQQSPPSAFLPQAAFPEQPGSCWGEGRGGSSQVAIDVLQPLFPPLLLPPGLDFA